MSDILRLKATLQWALLDKKNDLSGKYQVDLCNLSPESVTALKAMGVEARVRPKDPEAGYMITCKSNYPIVPLDTDGDTIEGIVGNGTKANCTVSTYSWSFKGKSGVSPQLDKLVITNMVEYQKEKKEESSAFASADFL
jgi:hypothetical protein